MTNTIAILNPPFKSSLQSIGTYNCNYSAWKWQLYNVNDIQNQLKTSIV